MIIVLQMSAIAATAPGRGSDGTYPSIGHTERGDVLPRIRRSNYREHCANMTARIICSLESDVCPCSNARTMTFHWPVSSIPVAQKQERPNAMVPDLIGFETDKRLASSRGRARQWLSGHSTKASKHSRKRRGARLILLSCLMACMAATGSPSQAEPPKLQIDAELRSLHVLPDSQFAEIGGETIHFVDEGVGASILLVHGSFASLRQWDYWAERLSEEFRVVRFDLSPLGLSGPHPENAYSVEDRIALIDGLMDRLGIGKFTIVGTSSSGVPVTAYAAARPDRLMIVLLRRRSWIVGPR